MRMSKLRLAEYHYRKASQIHPQNAVLLGCVGVVRTIFWPRVCHSRCAAFRITMDGLTTPLSLPFTIPGGSDESVYLNGNPLRVKDKALATDMLRLVLAMLSTHNRRTVLIAQ